MPDPKAVITPGTRPPPGAQAARIGGRVSCCRADLAYRMPISRVSGFADSEVSGERAGGMMMEAQLDVWAGQLLKQIAASELAAVTDALGRITDVVLKNMQYLREGE